MDPKVACKSCINEDYLFEGVKEKNICSYCQKNELCIPYNIILEKLVSVFDRQFIQLPPLRNRENKYAQYLLDSGELSRKGINLRKILEDAIGFSHEDFIHDLILDLVFEDIFQIHDLPEDDHELLGEYLMFEEVDSEASLNWKKWTELESSLKASRFFNSEIEEFFSEIIEDFINISNKTSGQSDIIIGADNKINKIWRARVFLDDYEIEEVLLDPVKYMGAPPPSLASQGRMNAEHVSVFYSATNQRIAISEVRPPVGSTVIAAQFKIKTPLRIFSFNSFERKTEWASYFDLEKLSIRSKIRLFKKLYETISRPILPGRESSEYLVTQAFCEYLANKAKLKYDGIAYPSSQHNSGGLNIALFPHISKSIGPSLSWKKEGSRAKRLNNMFLVHKQMKKISNESHSEFNETLEQDIARENYEAMDLTSPSEQNNFTLMLNKLEIRFVNSSNFETEKQHLDIYESEKPFHEIEEVHWTIGPFNFPPLRKE